MDGNDPVLPVPAPRSKWKKKIKTSPSTESISISVEREYSNEHNNVPDLSAKVDCEPCTNKLITKTENSTGFLESDSPPDNNNVPNLTKNSGVEEMESTLFSGESPTLEKNNLGIETVSNSFVNYSDSIDNNCILLEQVESRQDSLRGALDDFEAEVVQATRSGVLSVYQGNTVINMRQYLMAMLQTNDSNFLDRESSECSDLSDDNTPARMQDDFNYMDSDGFTLCRAVLCPQLSEELPEEEVEEKELEYKKESEVKKVNKISRLIDFFECTVHDEESIPKEDIQRKIFEEVSNIREIEKTSVHPSVERSDIRENSFEEYTYVPDEYPPVAGVEEICEVLVVPQPEEIQEEIYDVFVVPQPEGIQVEICKVLVVPQSEEIQEKIYEVLVVPQPEEIQKDICEVLVVPQPEEIQKDICEVLVVPQPEEIQEEICEVLVVPQPEEIQEEICEVFVPPPPEEIQEEICEVFVPPPPEEIQNGKSEGQSEEFAPDVKELDVESEEVTCTTEVVSNKSSPISTKQTLSDFFRWGSSNSKGSPCPKERLDETIFVYFHKGGYKCRPLYVYWYLIFVKAL